MSKKILSKIKDFLSSFVREKPKRFSKKPKRFSKNPKDSLYTFVLVDFILEKNRRVLKSTGITYVDKQDIQDIVSWKPHDAERVYKHIRNYIVHRNETKIRGLNWGTCPWCVKHYRLCNDCSYKRNHGIPCSESPLIFVENSSKVFINYIQIIDKIEELWGLSYASKKGKVFI